MTSSIYKMTDRTSIFGAKTNPKRKPRILGGIQGDRREVVIAHYPSTIRANQELVLDFPLLGADDVLVPGTAKLAFKLELSSQLDPNRTIHPNLSRNLVSDIRVGLQGNEFYNIANADIYYNYKDLWLYEKVARNEVYRGLENVNVSKLRLGAADANPRANDGKDQVIADVFGNRYAIPLDFDILTMHEPFVPDVLAAPLSYTLHFAPNEKVVYSTDPNASYKCTKISLEYEVVTNRELAKTIRNMRKGRSSYLLEHIQTQEKRVVDKRDTKWNIRICRQIQSLRGIFFLWKDPSDKNPQHFYNPRIRKTTIVLGGEPNQLYTKGKHYYQHWREAKRFFGGSDLAKDLHLYGVHIADYYHDKYTLFLDFRTTDSNELHGNGRTIEAGKSLSIELDREAELPSPLEMYIFLVIDAELVLDNGNFAKLEK